MSSAIALFKDSALFQDTKKPELPKRQNPA